MTLWLLIVCAASALVGPLLVATAKWIERDRESAMAEPRTFAALQEAECDRLEWAFARDELTQLDFEQAIDKVLAATTADGLVELRRPPMGGLSSSPVSLSTGYCRRCHAFGCAHHAAGCTCIHCPGRIAVKAPPKPIDAGRSARPIGPMQFTSRQCAADAWAAALEHGVVSANEMRAQIVAAHAVPTHSFEPYGEA